MKEIESAFSAAKTTAAANIKKTLGLVEAYTATHLGRDITTVSIFDESQLQDENKLRSDLKLSLTSDSERPATVEKLAVSPSIDALHKDAVDVLALTPNLANTISHLEKNPLIEGWVEKGLPLHSEKDECEFCGGDLSKHRLVELQAHFSKDLAEHKRRVQDLHNRIKAAKVSITLPKEVEFNSNFRDKFRETVGSLSVKIEAFNMTVDTLVLDVQQKIDAPFKVQEPTALPEGITQAVIDAVNAVNQVIDDNNQIAFNFTKAKQDAIKRAKLHLVQVFIDEQANVGHSTKVERLMVKQERLNRFAEILKKEADKLRAIISHAQLGRENINIRLTSMLGGEAVQINVVPEGGQERFQLIRKNGRPARNLSDGEKTAIAFSYFLTKLTELKPEKFEDTIVYIDDPISSLDANHIFQVTAAIREFFFHQVQNNGNLEWTTRCKQLFVSTHNFEFLSLLREVKPDSQNKAPLYLVKRIKTLGSSLEEMPISLSRYASEYHFLFEIIYRFHKAPDKTDHEVLMLLPNAVRRFVELYTYSRLPGVSKVTVDQRAEALFGKEKAKRILKVLHYFSHANSIEL